MSHGKNYPCTDPGCRVCSAIKPTPPPEGHEVQLHTCPDWKGQPQADAVREWQLEADEAGIYITAGPMFIHENIPVIERSAYERVVRGRNAWERWLKDCNAELNKERARSAKLLSALKEIQGANGSSEDEDFITTTARDAIREWEGSK